MNMDKLVTIERQTTVQDSTGGEKEVWEKVSTAWARIAPLSGRQFFAASGDRAEVTHEIYMRHGVDIGVRDRIVYGARIFDVRYPINMNEENRYINARSVEHA